MRTWTKTKFNLISRRLIRLRRTTYFFSQQRELAGAIFRPIFPLKKGLIRHDQMRLPAAAMTVWLWHCLKRVRAERNANFAIGRRRFLAFDMRAVSEFSVLRKYAPSTHT